MFQRCPFAAAGVRPAHEHQTRREETQRDRRNEARPDLHPFWQRVRASAGLKDARIHGLRNTFASTAVISGQGLPMIGKALGHTQIQTTARYAHLIADPIKSAVESVSGPIAASLSATADR